MSHAHERTAVVTGASRGFGFELSNALVGLEWNLVIDSRGADDLKLAARSLDANSPGEVVALRGDVSDQEHITRLVAAANDLGGYRLLVNNASALGPSPLPPLSSYPIDRLREVFEVNVLGPLQLIQQSLPCFEEDAIIVNVSSDAAVEHYEGWGGYGASKAALEQLSGVLAVEQPDLRIYWIDPGDMNTRMHQDAFPGEDISDRPDPWERVPGLLRLLEERPSSGRYRLEEFLVGASS